MEIDKLVDNLQKLIDSKKLLDKILGYFDVYSGQFEKIPDDEYGFNSYKNPTLNEEIRSYLGFDDSE